MGTFFREVQARYLQGRKQWERFRWNIKLRIHRIMELFGRFLRPVMTLAIIALGFSCFYFYITLRDDAGARRNAKNKIQKQMSAWNLESYPQKLKRLAGITTHNAKFTVLRDNMERLRLMLETYPVENKGYPQDIETLYAQASTNNYWNLYRNPITGDTEPYTAIVANYSDYEYAWEYERFKGKILYQADSASYRIYACDENGKLIEGLNGVLSISNLDD